MFFSQTSLSGIKLALRVLISIYDTSENNLKWKRSDKKIDKFYMYILSFDFYMYTLKTFVCILLAHSNAAYNTKKN